MKYDYIKPDLIPDDPHVYSGLCWIVLIPASGRVLFMADHSTPWLDKAVDKKVAVAWKIAGITTPDHAAWYLRQLGPLLDGYMEAHSAGRRTSMFFKLASFRILDAMLADKRHEQAEVLGMTIMSPTEYVERLYADGEVGGKWEPLSSAIANEAAALAGRALADRIYIYNPPGTDSLADALVEVGNREKLFLAGAACRM